MTYPCGTRVLVWRLEEASQLLALCRQQGVPCEDLAELPVKRPREKAVERLLLAQAFGEPVALQHNGQRAPSVEGRDANISITHTMGLVALAVNDSQVIGLDAESADRRQVLRVRDKYLNASEQDFLSPDDLTSHIIAFIKAERNSAIDWTDGIILEPFAVQADETVIMARCGYRRYRLASRLVEGHHITVALPVVE